LLWEVLEFIDDVTANPPMCGDMRWAVDLLLNAGNLADNLGHDVIDLEHVRRIHSETNQSASIEDLLSLPKKEKIVLIATIRALKAKKTDHISLKGLRASSESIREEYGLYTLPEDEFEETIQDLVDKGIIDAKGVNCIGINNVALDDISFLTVPRRDTKRVS
jgi:cell division control protein 6